MGILAQKPKFKVATPTIRVEKAAVEGTKPSRTPNPKPNPKLDSLTRVGDRFRAASGSPRLSPRPRGSASPLPTTSSSSADGHGSRKRKSASKAPRRSPASDRIAFDRDDSASDDEDWTDSLDAQKRQRREDTNRVVDLNRRLVASSLRDPPRSREELSLVHAAEVASLSLKCTPSLDAPPTEVAVELQYPGLRQRERYELVSGKDKIDAVSETIRVVKHVAETYLSEGEARPFLNPNSGLVRQLQRASSPTVRDFRAFKAALARYNSQLLALLEGGVLARNLGQRRSIPSDLVAFILEQVYDRTVAQKVELLAKYENGTDNVYGELLHPFISDILVRRTRMTSDQVFVDLGSGVGNVVLQAALDIGCESWGFEMMENACNLADAQVREFSARCRLWGVEPGKVYLERGDFRVNERVHEALKRADVVLVNNQAFTSQLNDDLVRMFLDLKSGCKIVSLKSFVHDQKNAANDVGSTILDVERLTYPEGYVSWTGAGGSFCISTRK